MVKQGADAILVKNIVIPASNKTSVLIGNSTDMLKTKNGFLVKPLWLGESGTNPCYINGIKGIISRDMNTEMTTSKNYYFTRCENGEEVTITNGILESFASHNFNNGIAIFWTGANGGYNGNTSDLICKIKQMICCGNYYNYIVVLAREKTDAESIQQFNEQFGYHLLHLPPLLNSIGLIKAGIGTYNGTQKNGIPEQLDSGDGLHYNYYGYKAIGEIIKDKLDEIASISSSTVCDSSFFEYNTNDKYGNINVNLTKEFVGDGYKYLNTQFCPFDEEKNWTICAEVSANGEIMDNYPITWMETSKYFSDESKEIGFSIRRFENEPTTGYHINTSWGGIMTNPDQMTRTDGKHSIVVSKNGDKYCIYSDTGLLYKDLVYANTTMFHDNPLTLCCKLERGSNLYNLTRCSISKFKIYDSCLDSAACTSIIQDFYME